jgi:hypothetical protein
MPDHDFGNRDPYTILGYRPIVDPHSRLQLAAVSCFEVSSMTAPGVLLPRSEARPRPLFDLSATQRKVFGTFLLFHGLAHAGVGVWASETGRWWLVSSLWELGMVGFMAAGLGALGVSGLRPFWRGLTVVGAVGSFLLFLLTPTGLFVVGMAIDVMAVAFVAYSRDASMRDSSSPGTRGRTRRAIAAVIAWAILVYVALVLALRPWNTRWGTTEAEFAMSLPGDEIVPVAHYRIDHAITINAPIDAVWPWLIQIGQDRGGFYSYSGLENAIGLRVTNADRIVPEWQHRHVGELVRSVPTNWIGGAFGKELGWRVAQIVPGRAIVLEGWGAFVLVPLDQNTTRMLIRMRGAGGPSLQSVALSPLGVLIFEPAHFIMERKMLLGIKERAERGRSPAGSRAGEENSHKKTALL